MSAFWEDYEVTGSLTAASPLLPINHQGAGSVAFQLTGTWTGTVTFEVNNDQGASATWVAVAAYKRGSVSTYSSTTTSNGIYVIALGASRQARVNFSTPTSGTVVVTARASATDFLTHVSQVFGTVTVDTELPAAAALTTAGFTIPTTPTIATALYGYNGTTLDLLKSTVANGLAVDVTRVTGTVTVDTEMPAAAVDADSFDLAVTPIPKVAAILHAMSAGGTLAGRVLSHTSASDGRANTLNGLLVQSVPYTRNAAGTNDAQRGINAATATTGTGLAAAGPALWDLVGATNYVRQAGDGSGRAMVVGPVAAGAAGNAVNPVLIGALNGSNNAVNLLSVTGDGMTGSTMLATGTMVFNGGSTLDRVRNNVDVTLLASAARTTTQTSADITTYNAHSIIVTVDVTATVSTVSLTLAINYKDPASGKYLPLLTGTTIAATGTYTYAVNPNTPTATGPWTKVAQADIGRVIQIVLTVGNANSQTYSIGYTLVP